MFKYIKIQKWQLKCVLKTLIVKTRKELSGQSVYRYDIMTTEKPLSSETLEYFIHLTGLESTKDGSELNNLNDPVLKKML